MRNFYITIIAFFSITYMMGQTFEFSLSYKGINMSTNNYQIAILATPSSTVTNATMSDMGAGLYLPSGLIIGNFEQGNSGLPGSEWSSQFMGSNANGDAYFVSRVEAGGTSVSLDGDGPFELVLFDVVADPNPTSGNITFIENGDPIFDTLFIQNYMNINLGAGPVDAYSQNDPLANNVDFNTLSNENHIDLNSLKVYPNPTSDYIFIEGNTQYLDNIELFSISGQSLMSIEKSFKKIDIQKFEAGIYFVMLNSNGNSKIIKVVKDR